MSGEDARWLPPHGVLGRAVPLGVVVLFGLLYAVASLLGRAESAAPWVSPPAAAAAAGSLLYAAWRRRPEAQPRPGAGPRPGIWRGPVSASGAAWRRFALGAAGWCAGATAETLSKGRHRRSRGL